MGWDGPDSEDLSETDIEDEVLLVVGDAVDLCGYTRRHDLVPSVDALDQVARVCGRAGTAEGMGEARIWRKVLVDGGKL